MMAGKTDTIKATYDPKPKKARDAGYDQIDRSKPVNTSGFKMRINGEVVK